MGQGGEFYDKFKIKTHRFIMEVYQMTELFPQAELYGASSQIRRAAVSIMLNYVEGFGRRKEKVKLNFFEIAYGSACECKYLIYLAKEKNWIGSEQYNNNFNLLDEISAMLWSMISGLEKKINE
ncbi:four helix bundle protein [Patescibacteria group bacterium]|nr:four helix bundle protein [Patescibacteria group bacterium]MBU1895300.1 four helix bundle protein [Patescibacteria group bacterium]